CSAVKAEQNAWNEFPLMSGGIYLRHNVIEVIDEVYTVSMVNDMIK
ncbi:5117_t:CDS:1, partial [Racocetra persica]